MPSPSPVTVSRQPTIFPTYLPHAPDRNPMFLDRRVYQGSSGRVYPLPCTDRIAETPRPVAWDTVVIENEYLRITILPELGGRIHRAQDKTNGYDFIYYQPVIKPALVGLAGPWASGGIEFNWPQHHRPSTFLPADVATEHHADGSATVWLSEHDPMARMKGMHGVRLHPGRAVLELVVRAYNRTDDAQTFLWWANVATRVHGHYQSFFPPDVTYVADHAKRATASYPRCTGSYYGVDYGARRKAGIPPAEQPRQFSPPDAAAAKRLGYTPDDLSWYANIPVPTSYMAMGSSEDFAGGYDHRAEAGIVSVADHHIAPGKKQWTWGNHEFGYAWDRNLTVPDETGEFPPYIELMSGVFTDNQPDFSHLQPGETKTWSQFWYPIRKIGPAHRANSEAAVSLRVAGEIARIGVAVTARHDGATIRLGRKSEVIGDWTLRLAPDEPAVFETQLPRGGRAEELTLTVTTATGRQLISYAPAPRATHPSLPPPAVEPLPPAEVAQADELYFIGAHLEQYRHATRAPESYWREALRRDPGDARCNLALGRWHLRRGEFAPAETHLRASLARQTSRNPNPADGEAYYQLGRCLRAQGWNAPERRAALDEQAYAAFYKATWNHAWQAAGFHALAEIDANRGEWATALEHVNRALRANADNLRARNLLALALRALNRPTEASDVIAATLALDPLDWWAHDLAGQGLKCDAQVRLDLALDYARIGRFAEGLRVLADAIAPRPAGSRPDASLGTAPLVHYYLAWLCHRSGDARAGERHLTAAAKADPDYCFPARLEEIAILEHAIATRPRDGRAPFYLGNLLYDRRRHAEAIHHWTLAVAREPNNAVAWRNLGIAAFNVQGDPQGARRAYARALRAQPNDARLRYESDQLAKRLGESPARRLRQLSRQLALVQQRDDLVVELCTLYNQVGQPQRAATILAARKFQPWEGGEGQALGQHTRTQLALGREALQAKNAARAVAHFSTALSAPENLGEAKHLLANQSDIHYWLGCAHAMAGATSLAQTHWRIAAETRGDFQAMSVRPYSEMTYYSALSLIKLGQRAAATQLLRGLLAYARKLARTPAVIDYFATSLPTLLLFADDLDARQKISALFLEAQARLGLGQTARARTLLRRVLTLDPNHPLASDLLASPPPGPWRRAYLMVRRPSGRARVRPD